MRRKKLAARVSQKRGLPPGTPVFIGEKLVEHLSLEMLEFSSDAWTAQVASGAEAYQLLKNLTPNTTAWINVVGIHDVKALQEITDNWQIHPLIVEDIANTQHRPKLEASDQYIFLISKRYTYDPGSRRIDTEQVSFLLLKNLVLTFQEKPSDVFHPVRDRLQQNRGRIRRLGSDYLFYSLLDNLTDSYYFLLEEINRDLDELEEKISVNPHPDELRALHSLKQSLLFLRKTVTPLREIILYLERENSPLISLETRPFLRDLYEHTLHVAESVETFREQTRSLIDFYLSILNNRMNEVMKVLTALASIFIPLTFITGIYGMNFEHMPELKWPFGYFIILSLMGAIAILLLWVFRKKRWL